MTEYEILYLVGESKRGDLDRIKQLVEETITAAGGEALPGEFADERRMEYAIGKERRGAYIARRFTAKEGAGDVPGAITKKLLLHHDILRFIVVNAEGLPTLEDSQERVKRSSDTRRRPTGRYGASRARSALPAVAPVVPAPSAEKPALSDTEIDQKLDEVLHI